VRSRDFPALDSVIRSSTLGQWTARIVQTLKTAGSRSRIKGVLEILGDEAVRAGPAERHRTAGIALMVAAVTSYALSWLQQPHQTPLALPVIALVIFLIGAALAFAGDAVASAWSSSRLSSLLRRFTTSTPENP
jgi:hypothetical protein